MMGSKAASGAFQQIIALMPPHDTYIELFAGSGAVLTRKAPASVSHAVDLDAKALASIPDLPGLKKWNVDARAFLDSFDYVRSARTLIYADPPYLHSTRTGRNRYAHEFTEIEHVDLLAQLRCVPCDVILSGYPSALYDSQLPGWGTHQFQVMTRGGIRTEQLWLNFAPSAVHWATYAGKDFIDRQRIKRKAQRWARNYMAMEPGERLAILTELLAAGVDIDQTTASSIVKHVYGRRREVSINPTGQIPLPLPDGDLKTGKVRTARPSQAQPGLFAVVSKEKRKEEST